MLKQRKKEFLNVEAKYTLFVIKMAVQLDLKEFGFQIKVIFSFIEDMQGLAMSRSFGDNVSKPIGVTHIP